MSTVSAPLSTVLQPLDRDHRRDLSTATRYLPFYTVTVDQTVDSATTCSGTGICPLSTVYSRIQSREERGKSGRVSGEVFASTERVDGRHATPTTHRGSVRGQGSQRGRVLRDRFCSHADSQTSEKPGLPSAELGSRQRGFADGSDGVLGDKREGRRGGNLVGTAGHSRPGRLTPTTPGRTAHV